jgi:hypothetical protein
MPRVIDDSMVKPATTTLLDAGDVDGGATDEQRAVIAPIVSGRGTRWRLHTCAHHRTNAAVPLADVCARVGALPHDS